MIGSLWGHRVVPRTGAGTPLESTSEGLLKRMALAGGVHPLGWVDGTPQWWKDICEQDESSKMWLKREGEKIRRRLQTKAWAKWDGTIPAEQVVQEVLVEDAPALPRRKLVGKIRGTYEGPTAGPAPWPASLVQEGGSSSSNYNPAAVAPVAPEPGPALATPTATASDEKIPCEKCGIPIKRISMAQHLRMYCPCTDDQSVPAARGNRKVLRPPPPAVPMAPPTGAAAAEADGAKAGQPNRPYIHVRWQAKPVPHMPRNVSSIPTAKAGGAAAPKPPPRAKRATMAPPPPPPAAGCWGGCSSCNKFPRCRRRIWMC